MEANILSPIEALKELFHSDLGLFEAYAGLLHLAMRPPQRQRIEEISKRQHQRIARAIDHWSRSVDRWNHQTLKQLGEQLVREAGKSDQRLAVELVAALKVLDDALTVRALEAHNVEVLLPEGEPFRSAHYRLLRPPEAPILGWIEDADLPPIPRDSGDSEVDLPVALELGWRAFPVAPSLSGVTTVFEDLATHVAVPLRERVDQKCLTVGLVSPINGIGYQCKGYRDEVHPKDGTPYRFEGLLGDEEVARGEIQAVLERCRDLEVDVLMYPELTLDADLQGFLKDEIRWSDEDRFPAMVIAGSFHESAANAGCYVNRTRIYDGLGEEIYQHDKLKRFRLTPEDIAKIKDPGCQKRLCEALGIDGEGGGHERIEQGHIMRIVDGPLGRMVTSICLDYCGGSIEGIAKSSRSNLFWVPTMSSSLGPFRERARELGKFCKATTVVVNSEWLLEGVGIDEAHREPLRSHCYLPFSSRDSIEVIIDSSVPSLRLFRIGEIIESLGGKNSVH